MSKILEINKAEKTYHNGTQTLKGINLNVEKGEIVGLIGPNGAGKTTLVKLILGLLKPTSGSVKVWKYAAYELPKKEKKRIGFLLDQRGLYKDLTVEENLIFWAKLYSIPQDKVKEVLKKWDLWKKRDERVKELSSGMEQKLAIARLTLNDPSFIIMDEPTSNLDPLVRKEVVEMLKELPAQGKTIFITSHDLFDIERLCTRIVLLRKGKIVVEGSLDRIKSKLGIEKEVEIKISGKISDVIKKMLISEFNPNIMGDRVLFSKDSVDTKEVVKFLVKNGVDVESVEEKHVSLEDLYVKMVREDEK